MVGLLIFLIFLLILIPLGIAVFTIICNWKVFRKADKEGWESIIPIYNTVVLIEISGLPLWYIALYFVPFANIYAMVRVYIELAHRFKQSTGFAIGLIFLTPIFLGILAFDKDIVYEISSSKYCGNCGKSVNKDDSFCVYCGTRI